MKFSIVHVNGYDNYLVEMDQPAPLTLKEALLKSPLLKRFPYLDPALHKMGVFGKICATDTEVQEGDRVEIYLPAAYGKANDADQTDENE